RSSLIAYVAADESKSEEQIRASLRVQLPAYMVPGQVVLLERLPLTRHGKVDEEQLRMLAEGVDRGEDGGAPVTETERTIGDVWAAVLGLERLGRDANFFDLGGHSLLATQAIARVRERFPVHIPLQWLFQSPTVAEFAMLIEAAVSQDARVRDNPIKPVARDGHLALSFAQQRFWYLDRLHPGNSAYNSCGLLRVTGDLNVVALEQAINEIVCRHEALRTIFTEVEGQPVQVVLPEQPITLLVADQTELATADARAVQQSLVNAEAERAFDLSTGPIIRANVIRMSESEHLVEVTMHHIATDGWSNDLFFKELMSLYSNYAEGRPSTLISPAIQYVDFAHWQREQSNDACLRTQLAYWQQQLADPPAPTTLSERPLPLHAPRLARTRYFSLDGSLPDRLRQFARENNVTLHSTLMAGFAALLHFYTGVEDLIIGTPVSNRNRKETEGLIGCLINTLALRVNLTGNPSFAELTRRVWNAMLAGHAHQDVPFEAVADSFASKTGKRTPLFRHWFVLQQPVETLKVDGPRGLEWEVEEVSSASAQFELTMMVREAGGVLRCALAYAAGELAPAEVQALAADYEAVLIAALEQSQAGILDLAWTERVVQQTVGQGIGA
ncbi:MAG TPA: condensation domain-containing protein, partial [Pyrinomonadaceae bacterium]|nr:condensation domain-containing protein [Pyrinomonadaceae bacterium]